VKQSDVEEFERIKSSLLAEFGDTRFVPDEGVTSDVVTPKTIRAWMRARGFVGWDVRWDENTKQILLVPPKLLHPVGISIRKVDE
jgi:hypothetical protein